MTWLTVYNSSGVAQGRVALNAISLSSFADAVAKIDDLILNGS